MPNGDFWNQLSALSTLAYCIITAVTLWLLLKQVRDARRYTLAEFIDRLGKEFAEFDNLFFLARKADPTSPVPAQDLSRCFRFFERVKALSDVGVLEVELLDDLFGQQFFWIVNNPQVQDEALYASTHRFPEIFALHAEFSRHRRQAGFAIPGFETDLALRNPAQYKVNLDLYGEKHFRRHR